MYALTFARLNSMGFIEYKEYSLDGVAWFKNSVTDVLLQQWDETMTTEKVLEECQSIRELVSKMGGNPWNTYYLLCVNDDELDDEKIYLIEHNAFAMRKYVIRSEYDLNRIPFLDISEPIHGVTSVMNEDKETVAGIVKEFVDYIIENEGANTRFSKDEVSTAILQVMRLPGGETE